MKVKMQWVSFYLSLHCPHFRYMFHGGTNFGYWNGESRWSLGWKQGGSKEFTSGGCMD